VILRPRSLKLPACSFAAQPVELALCLGTLSAPILALDPASDERDRLERSGGVHPWRWRLALTRAGHSDRIGAPDINQGRTTPGAMRVHAPPIQRPLEHDAFAPARATLAGATCRRIRSSSR
jgi:hypothetical protein